MRSDHYGLFHLCNAGVCSRFELMQQAAALAGVPASNIIGKPMAEMGRAGARPKYVVLEMNALKIAGIAPPRDWKLALAEYINTY